MDQQEKNQYLFAAPMSFLSGIGHGLSVVSVPWWLKSLGFPYSIITMFSLVNISFGFKFLWIPIFDRIDFTKLAHNFGLKTGFSMQRKLPGVVCIYLSSFYFFLSTLFHPSLYLKSFIACISLAAFWLANADSVLIAYNLETLKPKNMGITTGAYRIGMFFSSWTLLYLNENFGFTWETMFRVCAICMTILVSCAFFAPTEKIYHQKTWSDSLFKPYLDLINRYRKALLSVVLFFIFYKAQDRFSAPVNNLFIRDTANFGPNSFFLLKLISTFALAGSAIKTGSIIEKYNYRKSFFISFVMTTINVLTYLAYSFKMRGAYALCMILSVVNFSIIGYFSGSFYYHKTNSGFAHYINILITTFMISMFSGTFLKIILDDKVTVWSQFMVALLLICAEKVVSGMKGSLLYSYQASLCSKDYALSQATIITSIELATSYLFLQTYSGSFVDSFGWTNFYMLNIGLSLLPIFMYSSIMEKTEKGH